ncbi:MAG TPA: MarR family transcriptional regulator [bacterium]|nr:MarR family transcriptional regulator [bacterium]
MKVEPANFLFVLSKIRQRQFAFLEKALSARGIDDISPSFGDVLFVLDQGGPLSLREIARLTMKDKSTVSAVIKRLEAGGYVAKKRSEDDSRLVLIGLTEMANSLRPLMWEVSDAMNAGLFAGLSEREKTDLFRLLGKVYANTVKNSIAEKETSPRRK